MLDVAGIIQDDIAGSGQLGQKVLKLNETQVAGAVERIYQQGKRRERSDNVRLFYDLFGRVDHFIIRPEIHRIVRNGVSQLEGHGLTAVIIARSYSLIRQSVVNDVHRVASFDRFAVRVGADGIDYFRLDRTVGYGEPGKESADSIQNGVSCAHKWSICLRFADALYDR